jgi:hypothetical protein
MTKGTTIGETNTDGDYSEKLVFVVGAATTLNGAIA